MALSPLMLVRAILARVRAERRAEALAAGHGASVGGLAIGRRLQTVFEQNIMDFVVGAMVELPDHGLFAVLRSQVPAVLLVEPRKEGVLDCLDVENIGVAIVEGPRAQELADNLVALGALHVDGLQAEARRVRLTPRVPTPAWVRVAEVLTAAILGDKPGALLLRGAVGIVDTERPFPAVLDKNGTVELVDQVPGHGLGQDGVRFLESAAHNLQPEALNMRGRMPAKECTHISLELLVRVLGAHQTHPENGCRGPAHKANPVRRKLQRLLLALCAPTARA
mmetsp:Transcript_112507/g.350650  ORF Transcript_112507/g.350650 Transcript_112507/m.350650 type:complete len:280 (-) Transcript_112507:636-1475(-)